MTQRLVLFFLFFSLLLSAQEKDSLVYKNGIDKPNTTTAHHFGLFHMRINQNFKERPVEKTSFSFTLESANSFHPFVEMYQTLDPIERQRLSQLIWYQRDYRFIDQATTPAEYQNIHIDAVFKVFRFEVETKISDKHELRFTARTFMPTKGNFPFAIFTNDQSIEWFHSNVAGGEDPFGRRFFGMNQMNFEYTDRNNRTLSLNNNQLIFAGVEVNHFYYPEIFNPEKNLFVNFGSHLGINTSKYNPSLDVGISANIHKKWTFKSTNEFRVGVGVSGLRKGAITYGKPIEFGNNLFLGSGELNVEFTKYTRKGNYHAFSANYQLQTRYNKIQERDYYFLNGESNWQDINAGWHNGFSTLYETLTVWSILYTYGRKNSALSLYIQQDFKLNNAPDLETGISLKIPISKK
tara:strand:- start:19212 stop:20432 length:1221 start_codon:yes stop_codon:yes gene_type:complete